MQGLAPDVQTWVVGLLAAGVVAVFGFLVRKAFGDVTTGLDAVRTGLDGIKAQLATHDTHRATLELRVAAAEREVVTNRERYHELVNTLTARTSKVETQFEVLLERVRNLETAMRQVREGDE